ncbi:hypothetical protein BDP81DRAFT_15048 [Colletotrichum phormii]|uniref:Uncharacterized protein n=1 Tax=Colletotrichum phormii TaxID=359342 RepID=A0AAJ0EL94_9PEZI|nr:uncharacterized protein BDP81DRAFT_15048 [Colletotrichum phormii]KAK1656071.1 hypothetical protein BDP81DRAFT_15048 [Colletotrichum phormii]
MDPQRGTVSCRGLHKSRVHFIISTTSGRSFTITCLKHGTPCQGTTNHVGGWSSTARTKYPFLSDPDDVDRVGRGETVLQSDWLLAYGVKRRTSREGQKRREQYHWNSQHPAPTAFRPSTDSGANPPPGHCQAMDAIVPYGHNILHVDRIVRD